MIRSVDPASDDVRFELRAAPEREPRAATLAAGALFWSVVALYVVAMPYACGVSFVWPLLGLFAGARLAGTRKPARGWTLRARSSELEVEYDDGQLERYDWSSVAGQEVLDGLVLGLGPGRSLEIPDALLPDRAPLLAAFPEGFALEPDRHRRLVETPRWKLISFSAVMLFVLYAVFAWRLHR